MFPCLGGLGCRSWRRRLRGFEGILIEFLVKICSLDIKFLNGAGHLVDGITSDFICPLNPGIGRVARMIPKKMYLVLVLEHSLHSCSMVIMGNP